jgi:transketolase
MNEFCRNVRKNILSISKVSGHGHIPTCFSIVEILYAVYATLRHDPLKPQWPERDFFILSKGHGALAHYCVLAGFGYFPIERVYTFGAYQSDFGCHADRFKVPGIEASTGSLGHGIGIATGIALGLKIRGSRQRVITIIGDGEANEGSVWEALLVASDLKLDNLTVIYDDNRSHSRGLQIRNAAEKLRAFGCSVIEVDGHDADALTRALQEPCDAVRAIAANTVKGFGCRMLVENPYEWHRKSPDDEEFKQMMEELDAPAV